MSEYHPLPWNDELHAIYDANNRIVAGGYTPEGVALIVHSVNLHAELVEALREARAHVAHSTISVAGVAGRRSPTEIAATIGALLAKATS